MIAPMLGTLIRLIAILAVTAASWFRPPLSVAPGWIIRSDTIPAGDIVDNDVIITGTDVVIDGIVNGDVVALGSRVTLNGSVHGSFVSIADEASISGDVDGSVYVAATVLKLGPESRVAHNVHFGGLLLDSRAGSSIGRDLVAGSVRARIAGEIGRALNAVIALLEFSGKIGYGPADGMEEQDELEEGALLVSELPDRRRVLASSGRALFFVGAGDQRVAGYAAPPQVTLTAFQAQDEGDEDGRVGIVPEWLVIRLGDFVALLLVGGLLLLLAGAWMERCAKELRSKPLPVAGYGLVTLAVFLNGFIIAILVGLIILAIGLWLGSVSLWWLALLFWGVTFSAAIMAASLFALAVFFGSKVIVAYLVGKLIVGRLAPRASRYRLLPLVLGVVLYLILRTIPYLGWVVDIVCTVLGLGAIWLAYRASRQRNQENDDLPVEVDV